MGKRTKIMPQVPSLFPLGKGGKSYGKKSNLSAKIWCGLTVHIRFLILDLQAKFFKFTSCILAQFPANYTNSVQLFIHYTLCFRCMPQQRTL